MDDFQLQQLHQSDNQDDIELLSQQEQQQNDSHSSNALGKRNIRALKH